MMMPLSTENEWDGRTWIFHPRMRTGSPSVYSREKLADDAREAQSITRIQLAGGDTVACSPPAWTHTLTAAGRDVGARSLCAASPVARAHPPQCHHTPNQHSYIAWTV